MNGVSVVIPVFNRERYLEEAICSVLDQDHVPRVEVIVSDDGSVDRSLQIADSFRERVVVLRKPTHCPTQGASGARNRGLARATQPYVAFLDSDDFYLPGHLARMVEVLERRPTLGFVVCRIAQMTEVDGRRLFAPWTKRRVRPRDIAYPVVSGSNVVHTNAFLFRRSVFEEVGGFNETYSNHEDGDMWMRVSERYAGAFCERYGAVYRVSHGDGQLTEGPNAVERQKCLERVLVSALSRAWGREVPDRYRIFRLRLMLAALSRRRTRALAWVCARHPAHSLRTALSVTRIVDRLTVLQWTDRPVFATAGSNRGGV